MLAFRVTCISDNSYRSTLEAIIIRLEACRRARGNIGSAWEGCPANEELPNKLWERSSPIDIQWEDCRLYSTLSRCIRAMDYPPRQI